MPKPQQAELRRTGRNPGLDPDNVETRLGAASAPSEGGPSGPVPEDNRPGHHPEVEQDKPDPVAFMRRFGQIRPPARVDDARGRLERVVGAVRVAVAAPLRILADVLDPPPEDTAES